MPSRGGIEDAGEVVDETARRWNGDLEEEREKDQRCTGSRDKIEQQYMRFAPRLRAILRQRCPVCLEGKMFSGRFTMNPTCPVCGHRFEREQGFFQGAMYVSWVLGVTYLAVLAILAQLVLVPRIGIGLAVAAVVIIHVLCIPIVFRYSRVIWAHLNAGTRP
jgi:uncharacterized protein (DUF983 family)